MELLLATPPKEYTPFQTEMLWTVLTKSFHKCYLVLNGLAVSRYLSSLTRIIILLASKAGRQVTGQLAFGQNLTRMRPPNYTESIRHLCKKKRKKKRGTIHVIIHYSLILYPFACP